MYKSYFEYDDILPSKNLNHSVISRSSEITVLTVEDEIRFKYEDEKVHPLTFHDKIGIEELSVDKFIVIINTFEGIIVLKTEKKQEMKGFKEKKISYLDYPGMIDFLEKKKVIETTPSENIMCVDLRRFTLHKQSYEVDCLGTDLCRQLSDELRQLYLSHVKDSSRAN